MDIKQYDIILVNLEPTIGSEIKKTLPCVIISPIEMNKFLNTIIVKAKSTSGASGGGEDKKIKKNRETFCNMADWPTKLVVYYDSWENHISHITLRTDGKKKSFIK